MYEIIFLFFLGLIWVLFASVHDVRKKFVPNWVSLSLVFFALGFRFFYSLFESSSFSFFYQGVIGLVIFFFIGNLLYYLRFFAGGDAKLMIALGTILPLSINFYDNVSFFVIFIMSFLFIGAGYGLVWSFILVLLPQNFVKYRKELSKRLKNNKKFLFVTTFFGLIFVAFGVFSDFVFFYLGLIVFIFPYLYFYAKTIDDVCLVKKIRTSELEEGDWLLRDVRVGKEIIHASWNGLTKKQISKMRKNYKSVVIREGIPFVPVFLISFLLFFYIYFSGINLFLFN